MNGSLINNLSLEIAVRERCESFLPAVVRLLFSSVIVLKQALLVLFV